MRLERVSIANFKGLREVQFEPTRFSCLVGENNAGSIEEVVLKIS